MNDHKLFACETCVRDLRLAPHERSRGQQLVAALKQHGLSDDLTLRVVSCLNGCLSPCNIALRCRGKYSLRFSRLQPEDGSAVLAFAQLYIHSDDGDIPQSQWPQVLQDKLTVRIPPIGG